MLILLLRNPFAHTVLARVAAKYLKNELQTEIRIDKFEIGPRKSINLRNFLILDRRNDTLFYAGTLYIRIQHLSLKTSDFEFNAIKLENADIRLKKISDEAGFNFQFIADYFSKKEDSLTSESRESEVKTLLFKTEQLQFSNCHFLYQEHEDTAHHNAINFKDIDLAISELETGVAMIVNDSVSVQIRNLALNEKSGFAIQDLACEFFLADTYLEAKNLKAVTEKNTLDLDVKFTFGNFKDFNDFIHSVRIDATLRSSELNLYDAGYFAPVLFEMDNPIGVGGKISGTVDKFKATDFEFSFGDNTHYSGNVSMNGLPDFFETFIHLTIKEFTTTSKDISNFRLPVKDHYIHLPQILDKFGLIDIKGKFTGFYNDFVSYAKFNTGIGEVNTDILLKLNPKNVIEYSGKIAAGDFKAGNLFDMESRIGSLNLTAEVHGQGVDFESMELRMDAKISAFEFMNTVYNEMNLSGTLHNKTFTGYCLLDDEFISLDVEGLFDFSNNVPKYDFKAAVSNAQLDKMNLIDRDTSVRVFANLNINLLGNRFDNLQGIVKIDSMRYFERGESHFMKDFTLSITRDESEYTLIRLFSDFLDASVEGKFLIDELSSHFTWFMNSYLDTLITEQSADISLLEPQDFIFDLDFKNSGKLTRMFFPQISVSSGTHLTGGFNSQIGNLFFDASGDELILFGKKINRWDAEFHISQDKILLNTYAHHVYLSDSLQVDSLKTILTAAKDTLLFSVQWNNNNWETSNYGVLDGYLAFEGQKKMKLKFDKGNIVINDSLWQINSSNLITIDSTDYQFNNMGISSALQALNVNGKLSDNPGDTLVVGFENFNLSSADKFTLRAGIDLDGIINGNFKVAGIFGKPNFLADIIVSDLYFNGEKLGEAKIQSTWEPEKEAFKILGEIIYTGNIGSSKTLETSGVYYPNKKNNNFDVDIRLSNYKLKTIEPFVKDFSSRVDGSASGVLKLSGSVNEPDLTGELSLIRTKLRIDFLNVTYSLADKIYFDKNLIYFNNITVYDSLGNKAEASGKIKHDHLSKFNFDLNFKADKLAGLNTTRSQNESFYGDALASGTVKISGPPESLQMNIDVTSEKGTNIKIPVSYGAEVTENNYIVFTQEQDLNDADASTLLKYEPNLTGMTLNLGLNVTHDANIQMFLPYQMGNIQANGKGDIKMRIAPGGIFSMDGEYIINKGSLFLTLQNILNRDFDIRRGSKVAWSGDPYNAQIDLKAVYKIKTRLGEYVSEKDAETPVQVDCIIALSRSLYNPDIRFSFEFPDLKEDSKQSIYSQLDTNDQAMMSQQMISLLLLNSFYHSSGTSGSVGFNTFSFVTNQLNNLLSKLSDDVNIGINYRPGNELSSDEVELELSTQLFDERVLIDGNLGVKRNSETTNTNNLVGEVNVDFKITRDGRFRAKAFNKSNNNYLYKNYAPYTQGVGLFYTEDFNKFGELFRKKDKNTQKIRQKPPEDQSMNNK